MLFFFRVMKQALRSSGGNITEQHIVDVSLSALFLMEAAKKADRAFGVTPQTSAHTIRNAENEMVNHLLQKDVTTEVIGRLTPELIIRSYCHYNYMNNNFISTQIFITNINHCCNSYT